MISLLFAQESKLDHRPWNHGELAPANCRGFEADALDGKRMSLAGARICPVVACDRTIDAKASLENVDIIAAVSKSQGAGPVPQEFGAGEKQKLLKTCWIHTYIQQDEHHERLTPVHIEDGSPYTLSQLHSVRLNLCFPEIILGLDPGASHVGGREVTNWLKSRSDGNSDI